MPNKPDPLNKQVGLRVSVQLCRKISVGFSKPSDRFESQAFIRALEEATRDVVLTVEDYQKIASEVQANRDKLSNTKKGKK